MKGFTKLLVVAAVLLFPAVGVSVVGVGLVAYVAIPEERLAQEEARFRAALEAFTAEACAHAHIRGGCPQ